MNISSKILVFAAAAWSDGPTVNHTPSFSCEVRQDRRRPQDCPIVGSLDVAGLALPSLSNAIGRAAGFALPSLSKAIGRSAGLLCLQFERTDLSQNDYGHSGVMMESFCFPEADAQTTLHFT